MCESMYECLCMNAGNVHLSLVRGLTMERGWDASVLPYSQWVGPWVGCWIYIGDVIMPQRLMTTLKMFKDSLLGFKSCHRISVG